MSTPHHEWDSNSQLQQLQTLIAHVVVNITTIRSRPFFPLIACLSKYLWRNFLIVYFFTAMVLRPQIVNVALIINFNIQQNANVILFSKTTSKIYSSIISIIHDKTNQHVQVFIACLHLQFYMYVLQILVCPFVLFLLAIVLSVLLRYTDSDYPFGIFKLFLHVYCRGRSNYQREMIEIPSAVLTPSHF